MTAKQLSQLSQLNREIYQQQLRLRELEAAATKTTACITGMPFGHGVSDKVADSVADIAGLKRQLEINISQCWLELDRLNRYIDSVPSSLMRQILRLRYINALSWQQVAFHIGEFDEQVPRKKHDQFLRRGLR